MRKLDKLSAKYAENLRAHTFTESQLLSRCSRARESSFRDGFQAAKEHILEALINSDSYYWTKELIESVGDEEVEEE